MSHNTPIVVLRVVNAFIGQLVYSLLYLLAVHSIDRNAIVDDDVYCA